MSATRLALLAAATATQTNPFQYGAVLSLKRPVRDNLSQIHMDQSPTSELERFDPTRTSSKSEAKQIPEDTPPRTTDRTQCPYTVHETVNKRLEDERTKEKRESHTGEMQVTRFPETIETERDARMGREKKSETGNTGNEGYVASLGRGKGVSTEARAPQMRGDSVELAAQAITMTLSTRLTLMVEEMMADGMEGHEQEEHCLDGYVLKGRCRGNEFLEPTLFADNELRLVQEAAGTIPYSNGFVKTIYINGKQGNGTAKEAKNSCVELHVGSDAALRRFLNTHEEGEMANFLVPGGERTAEVGEGEEQEAEAVAALGDLARANGYDARRSLLVRQKWRNQLGVTLVTRDSFEILFARKGALSNTKLFAEMGWQEVKEEELDGLVRKMVRVKWETAIRPTEAFIEKAAKIVGKQIQIHVEKVVAVDLYKIIEDQRTRMPLFLQFRIAAKELNSLPGHALFPVKLGPGNLKSVEVFYTKAQRAEGFHRWRGGNASCQREWGVSVEQDNRILTWMLQVLQIRRAGIHLQAQGGTRLRAAGGRGHLPPTSRSQPAGGPAKFKSKREADSEGTLPGKLQMPTCTANAQTRMILNNMAGGRGAELKEERGETTGGAKREAKRNERRN